jgi:hypothetical protein
MAKFIYLFIVICYRINPMREREGAFMKKTGLFLIISMLIAGGCSTTKSPILYPNEHLNTVGAAQADRDIEECCRLAESYLKSKKAKEMAKGAVESSVVGAASGAAAGSVFGHAGRGAGAGAAAGAAASVTHSLFRVKDPDPVFMNFVNRCLSEKGYQPIGWE